MGCGASAEHKPEVSVSARPTVKFAEFATSLKEQEPSGYDSPLLGSVSRYSRHNTGELSPAGKVVFLPPPQGILKKASTSLSNSLGNCNEKPPVRNTVSSPGCMRQTSYLGAVKVQRVSTSGVAHSNSQGVAETIKVGSLNDHNSNHGVCVEVPVFISFAREEGRDHAAALTTALAGIGVLAYGCGANKDGGEQWNMNVGRYIDNCKVFVVIATNKYGNEGSAAGVMSTWDEVHYATQLRKPMVVVKVEAVALSEVSFMLSGCPSYNWERAQTTTPLALLSKLGELLMAAAP